MATVTRVSSGHWKAIIRRGRFGVRLKTKTFDRWDDADAWARKTEAAIQRGVWRDTGDAGKVTLRAAVEEYQKTAGASHRGAAVEASTWAVILDEPIARHTLGSIGRAEVAALRDKWRARNGYAIATVNKRLGMLHSVFEWAREAMRMPMLTNPVPPGLKLKGATERERRVSDKEIKAVIEASGSPVLAAFVRLALATAMRRGELSKMTWAMIDLNAAVVHLPGSITKNKKRRDVPLAPAALGILKSLPQDGTRPLPVEPHSVTRAFERAVARARKTYIDKCTDDAATPDPRYLVNLHFHDLRHESATRLAGIFGIQDLMKITGHSDARMAQRYYHPDAADLAAKMREAAASDRSKRRQERR